MKRLKKLWIMAGVLGLCLVLTLTVVLVDHKMETIHNSGETILSIPVKSVTALSWQKGTGEALAFTRDDSWHYAGDPDFPVSTLDMENMLVPFENFTAAFIIEDVEDFGQYGLDAPLATIKMSTEDQDYTVTVGDYSAMDSQRYVSIDDGNVYLMNHDPMEEFSAVLSDVIDNDKAPYLDKADRVIFSGKENYEILREPENGESYREEDLYFAKQGEKLLPLDTRLTEDFLYDITLVGLTDYKTYTASQEDLHQYGMDAPEQTIQVEYTVEFEDEAREQRTFQIHLSLNPEEKAAALAAKEAGETVPPVTAYARVGESEIIYEILPAEYQALTACGYDDLRHREILPLDFSQAEGVDITLDGQTYRIRKEMKEDVQVYTYQEEEIDIVDIGSALNALRAETFTEENPTGKLEIRVELLLPQDRKVCVELYRYDGTQCLAKVQGQVIGLIPRSQAVTLMEAVNAVVLNRQ